MLSVKHLLGTQRDREFWKIALHFTDRNYYGVNPSEGKIEYYNVCFSHFISVIKGCFTFTCLLSLDALHASFFFRSFPKFTIYLVLRVFAIYKMAVQR